MFTYLLPLPTEATTEKTHLHGPTPSHVPLKTTNYSRKLDSCIRTHHRQPRKQTEGQENLKQEGGIGSLTTATISKNFDSFKLTRLLSNRFRVFDVICVALLVKQERLSRSRNQHKHVAIVEPVDDSCM